MALCSTGVEGSDAGSSNINAAHCSGAGNFFTVLSWRDNVDGNARGVADCLAFRTADFVVI